MGAAIELCRLRHVFSLDLLARGFSQRRNPLIGTLRSIFHLSSHTPSRTLASRRTVPIPVNRERATKTSSPMLRKRGRSGAKLPTAELYAAAEPRTSRLYVAGDFYRWF